jgi:diverged AAA-family ATPase containing protein
MKENIGIEKELLDTIFNNFKVSSDCNGLASYNLNINCKEEDLLIAIANLITANKISLLASEHDENPHIIRFGFPTKREQIGFLQRNKLTKLFCLYPSVSYLSRKVKTDVIPKFPFKYMMQQGKAQFKACYFEWGVLFKYFSDPRYKFEFSDYIGKIESTDEVSKESYINLRTFGVGKDCKGNRVVVAFPKDLSEMSSACQIEWYSKLVPRQEQCFILDDYQKNLFGCCWNFPSTVYTSIVQEIANINILTKWVFSCEFFSKEFDNTKPIDFDMIYLPTYKVYMDYVSLLEKIVASNINKKFFAKLGMSCKDSKGNDKGTLHLLKEWLQLIKPEIEEEIHLPLKDVRDLRQIPAHKIEKNKYDIGLFNNQHDLTVKVFNSLNLLRRLMQTLPKAKNIDIRYKETKNYIVP